MYCFKCKKDKDIIDFKIKQDGYYPRKCIDCTKPVVIKKEVLTLENENTIIELLQKYKTIVLTSLYHWCKFHGIYSTTFNEFQKDIKLIIEKNQLKARYFIYKGNCSITGKKIVKSKSIQLL